MRPASFAHIVIFGILLFAQFLLFPMPGQAQTDLPNKQHRECAADEMRNRLFARYPKLKKRNAEIEARAYRFFLEKKLKGNIEKRAAFTLPVVFHIVHQNGPENITDAQVLAGLEYLNEAFGNTGFYDQGNGVDTDIRFCLAKRDPDGNPTTGINRVVSPLTNVTLSNDLALKDLIRWDPTQYINIWLVHSINNGMFSGYAYLPFLHGLPEDGIVMLGSIVPDLGNGHSTLVHEMGHYLGLYHTFQSGCTNNDCLLDGDRVCDTPPDNTTAPPGDCTAIVNSCTTDTNSGFDIDQNDINWNYVDYGNRPCRSGYTQGQADRMVYFIENIRQSLLNSPACNEPCTSQLAVSFNAGNTTVAVGNSVDFTNTTTGGTLYTWLIDGTPFATTTHASYVFNVLGTYTITLLATNADPNCTGTFSLPVEVVCPISAAFLSGNLYPQPGETVDFTNQSTGATAYHWSVNGSPVATSSNYSHHFTGAGSYKICLEAGNGFCSKTFCQLVFVLEGEGECVGTFIKRIGNLDVNEIGYYLIPSGDNNYFLGGSEGNRSIILKIDPSGNVLEQRSYKFTSGNDLLANLLLDDEGYLVGSVRDQLNTVSQNVFFKLHWETGLFAWTRSMSLIDHFRFDRVFQHPVTGNYIFHGLATVDNYIRVVLK